MAGALGLIVALQPPALVLVIGIVGAILLAAMITPLAPLVALLILAPMRTLIATEAAFQLPLDIGQITLVLLLGSWLLYHVVRHGTLPALHWSPVYIPLLIFVAFIGLTGFKAASLSNWLNEWLKWIQIVVLVAFALDMARRERWQWLLFGLILAGLGNAIIGLYEFLGGSGADHLLINDRFFRAFGTFGQPNPFAGFMGLIAPLALAATIGYALRFWHYRANRASLYWGAFYGIASAFIVLGIGISWSRGAWLGFAAALTVMIFAMPRKTWQGVLLMLAAVLGVGTLWLSGLLPQSIVARISSSTEEFFAFEDVRGVDITPENYAVVERLSHWQAALNMTRSSPWLGVGMGNYEVVYPQFRLLNWDEPLGHAHNYYLNMMAEGGLLGLLVYGKVWISILFMSWQVRRHPDVLSRLIGIGLLGTWTYLSVHSFFDNLYVNNLFLHMGVMIGILAVLHRQTSHFVNSRLL
ncbi:MAG: O-antigen ligase family protein [Anaerolineae bacterium]|nr:O-antigen ligase family protein [Anaerolineae bacterium]